ncbi:choice-of-anchor Q domain-containing protein [Spirosoma sp.]|uniref:choice-of-anchor Q domain-containing protein n=1 Tax=Spirosoma sp. TaxID=1899569 RepID=UPI003B3B503F
MSAGAQSIRYVKAGGSGDGSSWVNASGDLQAMIDDANVEQVWVAAGTYKPTVGTDRSISFHLKNGVTIYGGFPASGNPALSERRPDSYTTTLSGDIGTVGINTDNTNHVIYNPASLSLTNTAVLDGFFVSEGNTNRVNNYYGSGLYNNGSNGSICSPTIRNCTFMNNIGGGVYNNAMNGGTSNPAMTNCNFIGNSSEHAYGGLYNVSSNPILTNCNFIENFGKSGGGGIYNLSSNPLLINCNFIGNICSFLGSGSGGGINNEQSSPLLINCSFLNNTATINGGAIYNIGTSHPTIINCSFEGNHASLGNGGAVYNEYGGSPQFINCSFINSMTGGMGRVMYTQNGNAQLTNCILWNNGSSNTFAGQSPTVSYSLLEPGVSNYIDGAHNLTTSTSPFVSDTDLRLKIGSPAVNKGNNLAYTTANGPANDLAGMLRLQGGTVDMGAYELSSDLTPILYARLSSLSNTRIVSVVVDVFELNSVSTSGPVTIRINKDPKINLALDTGLSLVGGKPVQNSAWTLDNSDPDYYVLNTNQLIAGGEQLSVGLSGQMNAGSTSGVLSISGIVLVGSDQEVLLTNNVDADKIDYFQQ